MLSIERAEGWSVMTIFKGEGLLKYVEKSF